MLFPLNRQVAYIQCGHAGRRNDSCPVRDGTGQCEVSRGYSTILQSLSCIWFFVIPCTVAHQALLSTEFSRQEYWSGLPFPFSGDFPDLGIEPESPALQAGSLLSEPPGKAVLRTAHNLKLITCLFLGFFIDYFHTMLHFRKLQLQKGKQQIRGVANKQTLCCHVYLLRWLGTRQSALPGFIMEEFRIYWRNV